MPGVLSVPKGGSGVKNKLNPRKKAFVAEYLKDKNGKRAAIRAGYSAKTAEQQACRLLRNVQIKELVESALQKAEEKAIVDVAYVLTGFKEVAERCMQRQPVMMKSGAVWVQKADDNGEGVWEFDSMGANKALEQLGKYLQMFTDKIDVTSKGKSIADVLAAAFAKIPGRNTSESGS